VGKTQLNHSSELSMIGEVINDRYRLIAVLGQGGMGAVYLAYDSVLERDVALKLMSNPRLGTEGRSRLLVEAQTVAKLKHPNIVTVHDAGEFEGQPYIVMEYVEGVTLNEYEADGLEDIIEITRQICAALQHAHDQNIVHRDLKPENVVIEPDGSVRLMDFGLALSTSSRMTEEGMITGTVFYMPPEQAFGYEVTPQSDLYSLGVILYELTTQQLPFEADDALAVITQHIHAPVVPPRAKNEQIPIPLNDLILSLLGKEPNERPKSAAEVSSLLDDTWLRQADETSIQELYVLDRIVRGRFVGRQREFAEARTIWRKASSGQGQALLISGEPGIGKTRLMREVVTYAEVSGGTALVGECYAESSAPYSAFTQITRQALTRFSHNGFEIPDSILDDLLKLTPDLQHQFPNVQPNPKLDPETEQQRLFENIVSFCCTLTKEFPLLLVIDDVHWADSGTLALLHHLIRRTQKRPVMILVTYREVELKESRPFNDMLQELNRQRQGSRLKLQRLDLNQTHEMLAAIFATEITPEFLDGIYRETDGNPFFIEEVCRALVDTGEVYYQDGDWHRPPDIADLEIPQGVQVAVESRLAKLTMDQQETLRMAAILGREFCFNILLECLNLEEDTVIEALEAAEEAQMIQEIKGLGDVTFSFVHALVPNAITESVRTLRRRKLHRLAARAIEKYSPEDYETLAYQYGEAGDEARALKYYAQAGERALAAFANQDAERYFLAALDLVEYEQEEAHLMAQLGIAQAHQSKYSLAIETWGQAIEWYLQQDDKDKVAEFYARSGRATWEKGDIKTSLAICHKGLSAVTYAAEGPGLARLLAETSRNSYFNGLHGECERYGRTALQMAERLSLTIIEVEVLTTLGILPELPVDQSITLLERAVEQAERGNLPRQAMRAHNNLSVQYIVRFDFPKSTQHIKRAAEIAHQVGDPENELFFQANLGNYTIMRGQLKIVSEMLPDMQELMESLPEPGAGGINLRILQSGLLMYQGNLSQALIILIERAAEEREAGDLQSLQSALRWIAMVSLMTGDLDQGKTAAEEMITLAEKEHASESMARSFLSRIHTQEGEIQKAWKQLEEAHRVVKNIWYEFLDPMYLLWAQADLLAAEKKWDEAWLTYDELMKWTTEKGLRWHTNRILFEKAEAFLARNDPGDMEKARQMLEKALSEFEVMGADGFAQMVAEQLLNIG
jgi:tetratricopeptide (TPR) repeat protein/predicted Ser/Thr protein kinase